MTNFIVPKVGKVTDLSAEYLDAFHFARAEGVSDTLQDYIDQFGVKQFAVHFDASAGVKPFLVDPTMVAQGTQLQDGTEVVVGFNVHTGDPLTVVPKPKV